MSGFGKLSVILACVIIAAVFTDALPGRERSRTQQCRDHLPDASRPEPCTIEQDLQCAHLICAQVGRGDILMGEDFGPVLDGTWCGDNKICLQGSCVNDPEPPKNSRRPEEREHDCNYVLEYPDDDVVEWEERDGVIVAVHKNSTAQP